MAVLAIDPGTKTGGALLASTGDPLAFAIEEPTVWQRYRIVRWAVEWAKLRGEALEFVVEDQHLTRGPRANPAATIALVRDAERWITVVVLLGVAWIRVRPSSWHVELASVPKVDDDGHERTPKDRARILVERLWPAVELCRGEPGEDPFVASASATMPMDSVEAIVMARWRLAAGKGKRREAAPRKRSKK